jgi:hypothetical protein
VSVLYSVDLDDQPALEAHEIYDEASQWMLAAKLEALEPALAHLRPENALFLCRLAA